jgi:hypothetical protein
MASKNTRIFILILFVCFSFHSKAQNTIEKLPDHIHKIFIEYDNNLGIDNFENVNRFKSLFNVNVADTLTIPHDLYYTGLEYGFNAKNPLTISELNQIFTSKDLRYYTNIRRAFFQFGERVTLQSRFGYKLYQYQLKRMLYHENYKINKNEFAEIPYYITLLSYNDPNNSTLKKASIIKVSDSKTDYPFWLIPESFSIGFQQGVNRLTSNTGISDYNNRLLNLKTNFLLGGKKYLTYYLQLGAGIYFNDFNLELNDFSESFISMDNDDMTFTKVANYSGLSQKNELSMLEIPLSFKVQHYNYKNIFNLFASAGISYYTPLNFSYKNSSPSNGKVNYYGTYEFANGFTIDLKNIPEYGFDDYEVVPDDNPVNIAQNFSINGEIGINLRINKQFSLEAGVGVRYFLNDLEPEKSLEILGKGDGKVTSFLQKEPVSASNVTLNFGATYNLFPVRSPYYPVIDKQLLTLKGNKISKSNLTKEKIKLVPSSDFMMNNLKVMDYQFRRNNLSVSMQGKVSKKKDEYFLKVKVPKESSYIEIIKPINYDLFTRESDKLKDNMILGFDMNSPSQIHADRLPDLDIIILFKYTTMPPDNKLSLWENMTKQVERIISESPDSEKVLFANNDKISFSPNSNASGVPTYLETIEGQVTIPDMLILDEYVSGLRELNVLTKRRRINLHLFYLYKDMVFNTATTSSDFLVMYPERIDFVSKLEKEIFGNQFNDINLHIWSNFSPMERDLFNQLRTIEQLNWEYKIY